MPAGYMQQRLLGKWVGESDGCGRVGIRAEIMSSNITSGCMW